MDMQEILPKCLENMSSITESNKMSDFAITFLNKVDTQIRELQ